jgi:hypothetical protein
MLTADHIIGRISLSEASVKYRDHRAAILAGYFDHITEVNPAEVIQTAEVSKLLKWTFHNN